MVVIIGVGVAIVGTDASDAQIQAIGSFAFFSMLFTFLFSVRRLDLRRERERRERDDAARR
ncbi:MAG: hypothetical protein GXY03_03665 [Solirubrobacterales bacterium]|nr:hypothetical protein [Solirubrobacterales bacterium]